MYRLPMEGTSVGCLWGINGDCRYTGAGESLIVGNCDASAYSQSVKGAGNIQNCVAGWLTR